MVGMQNFQDIFETRKRSIIRVFSNCMTAPLTHFQLMFHFGKPSGIQKYFQRLYKWKTGWK